MNDRTSHPPQDAAEAPVCARASCTRPVPPPLGTRPRRYCSRSCRQRAYEERLLEQQIREARAAAAAAAVLRERASRDDAAPTRATSRDTGPSSRDGEAQGGRWVTAGMSPLPVWVPDR